MTRIQIRLGLALAALVALVGIVAGSVLERSLRDREIEGLRRSLDTRARLVAELVEGIPLRVERRAELVPLVDRAASAARARVTLIASDGTVVADSEVAPSALAQVENHAARPEVAGALGGRTSHEMRLSRTVGRRYLYLAVPVPDGSGVVRLARDLAGIEADAAALRRSLLPAGAIAIALALLLGVAAARRLLHPLTELREVLVAFSEGDLRRRLPWRSKDELGEIARVINRMAEELRDRIRDLTAEKEQLRAVLLGMVEGVLVVDRDGRVVLANPRLRDLFGVWGDVVGRPALEVIRRAEVEKGLEDAAAGEPVLLEVTAGEDRERHLQMHAVRFPAAGEHLGTVAVFHDVTELRRLERMRSEFVANVSHELKTPLTAIRGFAETLGAEGLTPEQRSQYLGVILRHAARLTSLIDDLLELSRIEGRQERVQLSAVDVVGVASGLLRDMAPRLAARRLSASLAGPDELRARTDRRALEQVLQNLLDNAVKYTDPGGRVAIRLARDGDRVRIDVSDTGIGIPESDQARVFERFYRVAKARARDLGGTGLGLSIVKHLVQAVDGEVFVESLEGKGTTFSVLIPAA